MCMVDQEVDGDAVWRSCLEHFLLPAVKAELLVKLDQL